MRPAALSRGASANATPSDVSASGEVPPTAASAAIGDAGLVRMRATPSATSARFSADSGTMSATVPSVARSVSSRHTSGSPRRAPTACTSLSATPLPERSRERTALGSSFGSATGTPAGRPSPGSWWSVTTTRTPFSASSATSAAEEMPQSTVTTSAGESAMQPLDGRRGEPVALAEAVRHDRVHVGAHRAKPASGDRRGRDAVEVEVAEHDDALAGANGRGDLVGGRGHARDEVRVEPVALEVGREEALDRLGRGVARETRGSAP